MNNDAYIMRTYSRLTEGVHKTFIGPHTLGVQSWPVT
jgi:hypothetical protein